MVESKESQTSLDQKKEKKNSELIYWCVEEVFQLVHNTKFLTGQQRFSEKIWKEIRTSERSHGVVDLICLFFLEKVTHPFQHNYFLQKWHILLEPPLYIFFNACEIVSDVQVPHDELTGYYDRTPGSWCYWIPSFCSKE